MKKLMLSSMLLASVISSYALSTQEIVNKALPSIVAILPYNENTKEAFEATGWFITSNRIVTNSHVISSRVITGVDIINVATGQKYTVDHVSYNNVATDIAIITVVESNPNHLDISTLTMEPASGMPVVIIGNPKEQYGKVMEGKLGGTSNGAPDKNVSGTMVITNIIGGSSGSPVLDPNGDVVAMIWGSVDPKNGGNGFAVNIQTLTLANLASIDLFLGRIVDGSPTPAPSPAAPYNVPAVAEEPKVAEDTKDCTTDEFTLAKTLLNGYLSACNQGSYSNLNQFLMTKLYSFYDWKDVGLEEATAALKKDDKKFIWQKTQYDLSNIEMKRYGKFANTLGARIPYIWKGKQSNGKVITVNAWLYTVIQLGTSVNNPAQKNWRIASIWTEKE